MSSKLCIVVYVIKELTNAGSAPNVLIFFLESIYTCMHATKATGETRKVGKTSRNILFSKSLLRKNKFVSQWLVWGVGKVWHINNDWRSARHYFHYPQQVYLSIATPPTPSTAMPTNQDRSPKVVRPVRDQPDRLCCSCTQWCREHKMQCITN